MPLPDERPRQSVANLIGRFENQTKRQASSNVLPPRSSSVISHHTGGSVAHDREWIPKSLTERVSSVESSQVQPRSSLPASQSAPQPIIPPIVSELKPVPVSLDAPLDDNRKLANEDKAEPQVEIATDLPESRPAIPTTPPRTVTAKSPTAKVPPTITSPKSVARTTSKQASSTSTVQPLKPQHTGASTTSTTSTRRVVAKVITPPTSNPKTPARSVAVMTPSRPKTPSSGLFAPTAASLAKSRSASSASTTPVKKAVLTTSASERLSKPTAASLSKSRNPVPPTPPLPRTNVKPSAGAHVVAKAKVNTQTSSKVPSPPKKAAPTVEDAICVLTLQQPETNDARDPINGHSTEEPLLSSKDSPEIHNVGAAVELKEKSADGIPEEILSDRPESESCLNLPLAGDNQDPSDDSPGDDIANIVNLLEAVSVPKVRPVSVASIPDEVHEIPDEE